MSGYVSEVNELNQKDSRRAFINVVGLSKGSTHEIKLFERIKGSAEAVANIFLYSEDEKLKDTICKVFAKHGGIFHAKWMSDDEVNYEYKAIVDLSYIPSKICKQFVKIAKWIEEEMEFDKKLAKKREIKLAKFEINLRKKANLSIFYRIEKGFKRGR